MAAAAETSAKVGAPRRGALQGKTALVTGGTRGIGYSPLTLLSFSLFSSITAIVRDSPMVEAVCHPCDGQACGGGGAGGAGGHRAHMLPERGGAERAPQGVGGPGIPRHHLRLRSLGSGPA